MSVENIRVLVRRIRYISAMKIPRIFYRKCILGTSLGISMIRLLFEVFHQSISAFVCLYIVVDNNTNISSIPPSPPPRPSSLNSSNFAGNKKLPGCIIIGARKGGTRALLEMLSLHPSVRMAAQEVHFFDNQTNYARGYSWYLSQMPTVEPGQIGVEKSPSYLVTPNVASRIRAMDPHIQLLVIVREPVTRLVSDFTQISYNRQEKGLSARTFDETIIKQDGSVNEEYYGVNTGLYNVHLEHWYKFFPRNQIHIVNGDRLIKTPWREIAKIEAFLHLPHKVLESNFFFNTTKGFHCLRPEPGQVKCLAKSKGRPHVNVSRETITLLRKFYLPHNLKFYSLTGTDFGWPED